MTEKNTITDSILSDERLRQKHEAAERELQGVPQNHPRRMNFDLGEQIIRNHSSVFNSDTEDAVWLIREMEASAPRPKTRVNVQELRANQAVYDDLCFAVSQSYVDDDFLRPANEKRRKK